MQITFPGRDGTSMTIADPRRAPATSGKQSNFTLPEDRRPASAILATMKV